MLYRLLLAALAVILVSTSSVAQEPNFTRTEDVIYGRKFGTALTMDVFTPKEKANGRGVIFCVSGGWVSSKEFMDLYGLLFTKMLLERGYVVFGVVHGSQPKFTIPEALEDMHRAVRYIRHNAAKYKVDPDKLGIVGGSAGGHLSLMMGTDFQPGNPKASDPVNRESSRVAAVACLYPPTDFLNYGKEGVTVELEKIQPEFRAPFEFTEFDPKTRTFVKVSDQEKFRAICKKISPIYMVTKDSAPAFIVHGDKDSLVPIQQSERIIARYKECGVACELLVKPGAGHGYWLGMEKDVRKMGDWLDKCLLAK